MLARIRRSAQEKDQGFTLIELLVVIVIIGILAAIAIPTFLNQRNKGYDSQARSDVRNLQIEVESAFTDAQVYPLTAAAPAYKKSSTAAAAVYRSADGSTYCISVLSKSGKIFRATPAAAGVVEGAVCT